MIKSIGILLTATIATVIWSSYIDVNIILDPDTLELLIESPLTSVDKDSTRYFRVDVYIINHSNEKVKLVHPGDGSQSGWRTPTTMWSVQPMSDNKNPKFQLMSMPRCGNTNSPEEDDLIYLNPNEKIQLKSWYGYPNIPDVAGTYLIQLSYNNEPKKKWQGLSLHGQAIDRFTKGLLRKIKKTGKVELISNEIIVKVLGE